MNMDLVEDDIDGEGELILVHCEEEDLMASRGLGQLTAAGWWILNLRSYGREKPCRGGVPD